MRFALLAIVSASCLGAIACGGTPGPVELAPTYGAGEIDLVNHLGWPFRLSRLRLAIDGRATMDADLGLASARILVPLGEGQHAIDLLADASYPRSALGGTECRVELTATKAIVVTGLDARITFDLFQRDLVAPFHQRLDVDVHVRGGFAPGWFSDTARALDARGRVASLEAIAVDGETPGRAGEIHYAEPLLKRTLLSDEPECGGESE